MSRGGPSLTALLGMLALAGYQNRDKISEWLGGLSGGQGGGLGGQGALPGGQSQGGPAGGGRATGPAGLPGNLGGLFNGLGGGQDAGGFLGGALGGLLDQFKQAGHGEVADSWVGPGQNREIAPPDLEQAIGHDTLSELQQKTGLSREEILSRLSRELPNAIDRYTPDGRLPSFG